MNKSNLFLKIPNENQLIDIVKSFFPDALEKGYRGIGDDCAVVPKDETYSYVISTDSFIEGVHFLKEKSNPADVGYKALAVNLSDIAAQGAHPKALFLSWSLPPSTELDWIQDFLKGFSDLARQCNVMLLGGNTSSSLRDIAIQVTILGEQENQKIKLRSGAQVGDLICVSGPLGDSRAGLSILLKDSDRNKSDLEKRLLRRHQVPHVRVQQGVFLAEHSSVHSMMDLSDGLSQDLGKILNSSKVSASIDVAKTPFSTDLQDYALQNKQDVFEMALLGGEDYELLFTINPHEFEILKKEYENKFSETLYDIGQIKSGNSEIQFLKDNQSWFLRNQGFKHF